MMAVASWNINGLRTHQKDLETFIDDISENDYIVICIQEAHSTTKIDIKGYESVFLSSPIGVKASRGLHTYIKEGYKFEPYNVDCPNIDTLGIRIYNPINMIIINTYIAPHQIVEKKDVEKLITHSQEPIIIIGDLNAHNYAWSSAKPNKIGKIIQEILTQNDNMVIMNDGSTTHLSTHLTFTSPDLCICSLNLSDKFQWSASEDFYSCDHAPQILKYTNTQVYNKSNYNPVTKYAFDRANWDHFNTTLDINTNFTDSNPVKKMEKFAVEMIKAADLSIPIKKAPKRPPRFWWNKEINDAIRERKRICKKAKKSKNQDQIIEFKKSRAKVKFLIKKSIGEKNKEATEAIQFKKSSKIAWNYTNRLRGNKSPQQIKTIKINNKWETDPIKIVEHMADELHQISGDKNYPNEFLQLKKEEEKYDIKIDLNNRDIYNNQFKISELNYALKTLKHSAPGPDGIYNEMLKNLDFILRRKLLSIINDLWLKGKNLESFNTANCIALKKSDGSRRYIALTSCLGKLFEKIVNFRLKWWLEKKNIFDNNQAGFRSNKSTIDNLAILDSDIKCALAKNQRTIAIFFDISKAYDCTWRHLILQTLKKNRINGKMLKYCQNYLINRKFKIINGCHESTERTQQNGVPQGGVLSVVLFLLAMESLKKVKKKNPGMKILKFADDIVAYCADRNEENIRIKTKKLLEDLQQWSNETGFNFSPKKTKAIEFRKTRSKPWKINLQLNNRPIEYVTNHKFLGLHFNYNLSWTQHIKILKERTKKDINLLKILSSKKWSIRKTDLITIFNATCIAKIDYGDVIYGANDNSELNTLQKTQNYGLRLAAGLFCTTKVDYIWKITNQKNLSSRRKQHTINYYSKINALERNENQKNYSTQRMHKTFSKNPESLKPSYIIASKEMKALGIHPNIYKKSFDFPPWEVQNIFFDNSIHTAKKSYLTNKEVTHLFNTTSAKYTNCQIFYTDGSVAGKDAGFGISTENIKKSTKIAKGASVFTAEADAIHEALNMYVKNPKFNQVAIFTDSYSCISAIKNCYNKTSQIQNILKLIYRNNDKNFHFIWIPSHMGIPGNEEADALARTSLLDDVENNKYHWSDLKKIINHEIESKDMEEWIKRNRTSLIYQITLGRPFRITELNNRIDTSKLDRARTGVTRLTHSHYLTKEDDPRCELCGQKQSIQHVMRVCSQLIPVRDKHNVWVSSLNGDEEEIGQAVNYLKEINVWDKI